MKETRYRLKKIIEDKVDRKDAIGLKSLILDYFTEALVESGGSCTTSIDKFDDINIHYLYSMQHQYGMTNITTEIEIKLFIQDFTMGIFGGTLEDKIYKKDIFVQLYITWTHPDAIYNTFLMGLETLLSDSFNLPDYIYSKIQDMKPNNKEVENERRN